MVRGLISGASDHQCDAVTGQTEASKIDIDRSILEQDFYRGS